MSTENRNTYNGWTNYETWAVKLLSDNEQSSYLHWQEQTREHWTNADSEDRPKYFTRKQQATYSLADSLKTDHEENNPLEDQANIYTDLLRAALSEVNWNEIAESLLEDFNEPNDASADAMEGTMNTIGIIREFKTSKFRVVVDAVEEFDLDLSWDESGETHRKLDCGDLVAFCARARVFVNGSEIASDYLGGCVYESLEAFMDHKECAKATRNSIRRYGRFQIYRKDRPYESCLRNTDKLRKRGFATRERAEAWAQSNGVPYDVYESGVCGSYFAGMVATVCKEARKALLDQQTTRVREASNV